MLNDGGVHNQDDVSFLHGDKPATCKVMAAGCRAGNPPTFMVLFEMAPANRQLSDGDARPWRHILQDLEGPTGETLAHMMKNAMLKTESALMNRLQTSAMTHDTTKDGWRKAPRRADGRFGLNAGTVPSRWDAQKKDEVRLHHLVRAATASEPAHPPFMPNECTVLALRTFVALFTTATGPRRKDSLAGEVRAMQCSRGEDTQAAAARAFLQALPIRTARGLRQTTLHADDCKVHDGFVLAKRTSATMLKRLNARLSMGNGSRPTAIFHHLTPHCNCISATTLKKAVQQAAARPGVFVPGEATHRTRLFWSFSKPLRLQIFNRGTAGRTETQSTPCNCHLFPSQCKRTLQG